MFVLIWLFFLLIFVILIRNILPIIKLRIKLSKLPGPMISNFLLGNLSILSGTRKDVSFHTAFAESLTGLSNLFRKEGIFRLWVLNHPYVVLCTAESIEPVVSSSTLLDKGFFYNLFHCWLGTGLLTSTGDKWRTRRKMITPTFHYRILDEFIPIFDKNSRLFIKNLEEYLKKEWLDIIPLVTLCTLDIISETAMGIEIKTQCKNRTDYIKALQEFSDIFMSRSIKPWLYNDFLFSLTSDGKRLKKILPVLHDLTLQILKQRKEELRREISIKEDSPDDNEIKKKEPLLDTLIKHQFKNSQFSDKDICEEVDTFMFEGHDTTSMGICWTLYHLGLHKDIQQKVFEELQGIFGDDIGRPITADDIREMKYLECVLKESERLSPSVPTVGRMSTEDIQIKGYTIPPGCIFNIFIYSLHRDPKVFPNPEVFDPDRFLPENCIGRNPYAFIPFSAGSRNCIGQKFAMNEMKVIVSRVIMNFVIESIDPPDKINHNFLLVLRPTGSLRLRVKRRNDY